MHTASNANGALVDVNLGNVRGKAVGVSDRDGHAADRDAISTQNKSALTKRGRRKGGNPVGWRRLVVQLDGEENDKPG